MREEGWGRRGKRRERKDEEEKEKENDRCNGDEYMNTGKGQDVEAEEGETWFGIQFPRLITQIIRSYSAVLLNAVYSVIG